MALILEAALIYAAALAAAAITALIIRAAEISRDFAKANDRRKRSKHYV